MTLDEMYIETAMYVQETITKSGGVYQETEIINRFNSALNTAYKRICKEKYRLLYAEDKSVSQGKIDVSTLTKNFFEIKDIKVDGCSVDFNLNGNNLEVDSGYTTVTIEYYYIPGSLTALTDVPLLPESNVDHKILCYFAAFMYLNIEDDDRAGKWISMWNDGFDSIKELRVKQSKVKTVYNVGW